MSSQQDDPFDGFEINDDWVDEARVSELSAQERADRYGRIARGNAQIANEPKEIPKRRRTTKLWPWLVFAGICLVVIAGTLWTMR